ncbi:Notchless protein-like protein [Triticum urartu]|uniref:Notchless protein-like protein n=1 Tax=Triticum urartu TaxID=4572 RepID=M7Z5U7_TRIUA|nr:Notchless protein-like protein [Triticum urartu]
MDAAGGNGSSSSVMCQLVSAEGEHLGAALSLPHNVGPPQLQDIVNQLLHNVPTYCFFFFFFSSCSLSSFSYLTSPDATQRQEDKLPYAFYVGDEELSVQLGAFMQRNNATAEVTLRIVYQPQAVFRIRPVNRCSATIAGHTEAVLAVSFSPDGRCLASGSGDTTVRFWDLSTQTPLYTCKGHKNWVLCIAWSPDGKHLVSGSKSGELILWDPKTGNQLGTPLTGHRKWITAVSWEPVHLQSPSRRFVSASKDGDARIWDITTKKCVISLSGHTNAVTCVKWGGDGLIYTGSEDCLIKVWETTQGKLVKTLQGHGHWVNSLALSTEYVLRTGAYDHTGKTFSSPEEMKEAALARYEKMRGNAPERLVSGSDDFTMFLWEPTISKQPKARMTGHQKVVNHVYFSPDGQWLASASFDKSVKLWNGITGKFVAAFRGHVADVYQISWSADSRLLLSGSKDSTLKSREEDEDEDSAFCSCGLVDDMDMDMNQVWDIRARKLKQDLPGHADEVYAVDWSPDGEKVVSGGKDRVLKLWMN